MQENNTTQSKLFSLFSRDGVSEDETAALIEEVGAVILESAVMRFVVNAEPEEMEAFENIISNEPDVDAALPRLLEHIPRFADILTEEVAAFNMQADALV